MQDDFMAPMMDNEKTEKLIYGLIAISLAIGLSFMVHAGLVHPVALRG